MKQVELRSSDSQLTIAVVDIPNYELFPEIVVWEWRVFVLDGNVVYKNSPQVYHEAESIVVIQSPHPPRNKFDITRTFSNLRDSNG